jgi:hypothetical protein
MKIVKTLAVLFLAVYLILAGLIGFGVVHPILVTLASLFALVSGILTLGALWECRHSCCSHDNSCSHGKKE